MKTPHLIPASVILLASVMTVIAPTTNAADTPTAEDLIKQSQALITAGKPEEALDKAMMATLLAPNNPAAHLVKASALMGIDLPSQAIEPLEKAVKLTPTLPGLHKLLGDVYLQTGQPQQALKAFDAERRLSGDSDGLSLRTGIAHLRAKSNAQAKQWLQQVKDNGPYAARAHRNLATLALLDGNREQAVSHLQVAAAKETDADHKKEAQNQFDLIQKQPQLDPRELGRMEVVAQDIATYQPSRPMTMRKTDGRQVLDVWVQLGIEYDDNVALVDNIRQLPGNISDQDDGRFVASLGMDWRPLRFDSFEVGTRVDGFQSLHFQESVMDFSQIGAEPYLRWRNDHFSLEGYPLLSYSQLNGDDYEQLHGGGLKAGWRHARSANAQLRYRGYGRHVALASANAAGNRNGSVHEVSVLEQVEIPQWKLQCYAGAGHEWQNTEGSDYDRASINVFTGLGIALPWKIFASASYTYTFEDYENANSNSVTNQRREDSRHTSALRFERPLLRHQALAVDGYIEYRHISSGSNIGLFEFDSNVVGGGVVLRF